MRALNPMDEAELCQVAEGMRSTLVEVLGPTRGVEIYDMSWLRARVRWHVDPSQCIGQVFVSFDMDDNYIGHTIVRVEPGLGLSAGLFSTTYVHVEARRTGVAGTLLTRGERWMRDQGCETASTWTADGNTPLVRLYERRGYAVAERGSDMIRLARTL